MIYNDSGIQQSDSYTSVIHIYAYMGFTGGSDGKESVCNAKDPSSILGLGRSPGGGNGNPPQYSHLGNPMDRGGLQSIWLQRVGDD